MSIDVMSIILSIILISYFSFRFLNGIAGNEKHKLSFDNFELGYIDLDNKVTRLETNIICDIKENREIKKLKNDIEKLKNRLNKKETVKSSTNVCADKKDNKLFEECVAALVALGYKKKAAKIEVEKYFQSKTASSAEEFINTFF